MGGSVGGVGGCDDDDGGSRENIPSHIYIPCKTRDRYRYEKETLAEFWFVSLEYADYGLLICIDR